MSTTISKATVREPTDPDLFELADPELAHGPLLLVASYSPAADEYFWPRRRRCPLTGEPVEEVRLEARGTLWSWSYMHMPWRGPVAPGGGEGYGVGLIDLPEGPRALGVLLGDEGDWEIGDEMVGASLDFMERDDVLTCLLAWRRQEAE